MHILATPAELFRGGAGFLTPAFRAWGSLSQDETVCTITEFTEFDGGSTGRKARLTVDYSPGTRAPRELFVKFSRDLGIPERDHGRTQMASEVLFAHLCRVPDFPVPVPPTWSHCATGTPTWTTPGSGARPGCCAAD